MKKQKKGNGRSRKTNGVSCFRRAGVRGVVGHIIIAALSLLFPVFFSFFDLNCIQEAIVTLLFV